MMAVVSKIDVYRIDGEDLHPTQTLNVESSTKAGRGHLVVLVVEGKSYEVQAAQLTKAVANASNV